MFKRCAIVLGLAAITSFSAAQSASAQSTPSTSNQNVELLFWQSIMSSKTPGDYQAYLKKFPDGQFADLAKSRLISLGAKKATDKSLPKANRASVASPPRQLTGKPPQSGGDSQNQSNSAAQATPAEFMGPEWAKIDGKNCFFVKGDQAEMKAELKSASWTGSCSNGYLSGDGTLTYSFTKNDSDDGVQNITAGITGHFEQSRLDGAGGSVTEWRSAGKRLVEVQKGTFAAGRLNGQGSSHTVSYKGNEIEEDSLDEGVFEKGMITSGKSRHGTPSSTYLEEGNFNEKGLQGMGKWSHYPDDACKGGAAVTTAVFEDGAAPDGDNTRCADGTVLAGDEPENYIPPDNGPDVFGAIMSGLLQGAAQGFAIQQQQRQMQVAQQATRTQSSALTQQRASPQRNTALALLGQNGSAGGGAAGLGQGSTENSGSGTANQVGAVNHSLPPMSSCVSATEGSSPVTTGILEAYYALQNHCGSQVGVLFCSMGIVKVGATVPPNTLNVCATSPDLAAWGEVYIPPGGSTNVLENQIGQGGSYNLRISYFACPNPGYIRQAHWTGSQIAAACSDQP